MVMFAIGIITARREKRINYLPHSLRELRNGGFSETINIFAEPYSPVQNFVNCKLLSHHKKLGNANNWLFALNFLLKNTQDDWIVISEDDISCKSNAYQKIKDFASSLDHQIGYISGFTSEYYFLKDVFTGKKKDWIEFNPGLNAYGNQFYVMPRVSAQLLLDQSKDYFNQFEEYKKETRGVDFIVSTFFEKNKLPCYYPIPSLFDHVADAVFHGYLY